MMTAAAEDADERIEQMILLTERLTALVADQAKSFEAHRPQDAAVHVEETGRLANLYRHESARIRSNPGLISAAERGRRLRLTRATEAFDAVLARQARAVGAMKTVTEGLVRAIAEEVASQRNKGVSYGPGALQNPAAAATAITLNKRGGRRPRPLPRRRGREGFKHLFDASCRGLASARVVGAFPAIYVLRAG